MATYATVADFENYSIGWTTTDPAELEKILVKAEHDVDRELGFMGYRPDNQSLKVVPTTLIVRDREALRDAVCAQTEYRIEMGEAFFRKHQHQAVSGPKFSTSGKLPYIGPQVKRELARMSIFGGSWSTVYR